MKTNTSDSVAMMEDDIRNLKAKKLAAEEKSAYWLMRANEIDDKIMRVIAKIAEVGAR